MTNKRTNLPPVASSQPSIMTISSREKSISTLMVPKKHSVSFAVASQRSPGEWSDTTQLTGKKRNTRSQPCKHRPYHSISHLGVYIDKVGRNMVSLLPINRSLGSCRWLEVIGRRRTRGGAYPRACRELSLMKWRDLRHLWDCKDRREIALKGQRGIVLRGGFGLCWIVGRRV
jgi:hypothetical protein